MPNTRRRQSSPRARQSSPRKTQTTPRMRKRTTTQRIKNRTTSQRKSSPMKNNAEFNLFEYLINEKLNTEKVKTYINEKITTKHPLLN